jgi:hypothetical protein
LRITRGKHLHLVTHVERLARLQIHLLLVAAVPGHEQLEIVVARFDMQTLESAVEVVYSAGVVAVHEYFGLTRSHL